MSVIRKEPTECSFFQTDGAVSLMRTRLQQRKGQGLLSNQKVTPFGEGDVSHRFEGGTMIDVAV